MNDMPLVSVLVVNFNGRSVLTECLDSLARQSYPRHRLEVIVVDNASTDDSVDWIRTHYPWVRLVAGPTNAGFAEGNNIAFRQSRGDWIALVNTDAAIEPDWVQKAVAIGQGESTVGGVVGRLVFRDRPDIVNTTGLRLLPDGRGADRDIDKPLLQLDRKVGEVFGGCGAAVLLRREMLDEVGLFDPRWFMYYEDLDLAWRARRAGWQFVYTPNLRGQHVCGASVGSASSLQTHFVERNRFLVNGRHAPLFIAITTGLGMFARCGRAVIRWLSGRNATTLRHVIAHFSALASAIVLAPGIISDRLAAVRRYGSADSIYRRWSRTP